MFTDYTIGDGNIVAGQGVNATALLKQLPDEVADRPGAVALFLLECTLNVNSAAGGAGITGRNMFDLIHTVVCRTGHPAERNARIPGLMGGHFRIFETMTMGIEPEVPADVAAAAGAATRQVTIPIWLVDPSGPRPVDHAASIDLLMQAGALSWVFANSPSALGGNANDTITGGTWRLIARVTPLSEGEAPQPLEFVVMDRNGSNEVNSNDKGRFRYMAAVQQGNPGTGHTGGEFAAGTITLIDYLKVGANQLRQRIAARAWMQGFNKDRITDVASRRVAPDDTAAGLSDFFPLLWPTRDGSGLAVPYGAVKFFTQGTNQNFRLFGLHLPDQLDAERTEVLVAMGYDRAAVEGVPAEKRVPITVRPPLQGHLLMNPRKRALLPQRWHGLTRELRKLGKK